MKTLSMILCAGLCIGLPACEGEQCDSQSCDLQCQAHGFYWGMCQGGECMCASSEICNDGIDNDGDGSADCWDYDCGYGGPTEAVCADGLDNDCDGNTDCWDPDCGYGGPTETICNDRLDNDCDGNVDCWDTADCGHTVSCSACNDATCAAECQAAGHTGGACVGGACQCSNTCTSHSQCSATTICYHGECQDPWGKEYTFTVVNGDFPDVDPSDGSEWDFGGSCPDTYVSVTVDGTTCNTSQIEDSCHPRWNHVCSFTLYSSSRLSWSIFDEDTLDYDEIFTGDPTAVTVDHIKAGGISWSIVYAGTTYVVLNITIAPR